MTDDYATQERLSIKLESGIPESEAIEQMRQEQEFKLDCLARHILNTFKTAEIRRAYLNKQEASKGKAYADNLRERVRLEFELRKRVAEARQK